MPCVATRTARTAQTSMRSEISPAVPPHCMRRSYLPSCCSAAIASPHLFPPETRATLKRWEVQVLANIDLHTDDSYQFSRAAKQVSQITVRCPSRSSRSSRS